MPLSRKVLIKVNFNELFDAQSGFRFLCLGKNK